MSCWNVPWCQSHLSRYSLPTHYLACSTTCRNCTSATTCTSCNLASATKKFNPTDNSCSQWCPDGTWDNNHTCERTSLLSYLSLRFQLSYLYWQRHHLCHLQWRDQSVYSQYHQQHLWVSLSFWLLLVLIFLLRYLSSLIRSIECCSPCSGCSAGPLNCTACNPTSSYPYLNATTHTCLASCPTGTWNDNSVCQECTTGCSACSSASVCSDCFDGFYLLNGQCLRKSLPLIH